MRVKFLLANPCFTQTPDIHLPLNNSLVVPIPFCSSWEFPEMEEFSFCLTVEINFVHFIRVKIGALVLEYGEF